jgi:hypothetical protein
MLPLGRTLLPLFPVWALCSLPLAVSLAEEPSLIRVACLGTASPRGLALMRTLRLIRLGCRNSRATALEYAISASAERH